LIAFFPQDLSFLIALFPLVDPTAMQLPYEIRHP